MPTLKTDVIKYYDYHDVVKEVEKKTGKQIRDWAGHFAGKLPDLAAPYQDFWHKVLDVYGSEIHNPCYVIIDFLGIKEYFKTHEPSESKWIDEVCDAFLDVMKNAKVANDGFNDIEGAYNFKIEW